MKTRETKTHFSQCFPLVWPKQGIPCERARPGAFPKMWHFSKLIWDCIVCTKEEISMTGMKRSLLCVNLTNDDWIVHLYSFQNLYILFKTLTQKMIFGIFFAYQSNWFYKMYTDYSDSVALLYFQDWKSQGGSNQLRTWIKTRVIIGKIVLHLLFIGMLGWN